MTTHIDMVNKITQELLPLGCLMFDAANGNGCVDHPLLSQHSRIDHLIPKLVSSQYHSQSENLALLFQLRNPQMSHDLACWYEWSSNVPGHSGPDC
jgi:hypothetical protein